MILDDGADHFKGINFLLNLIDQQDEKILKILVQNDPDNSSLHIDSGMLDLKIKIVKYIIEGCFYLSKNPVLFKNKDYSVHIIEPLLSIVQCEIKLKVFNQTDLLHIIKIISNLVNGTSQARDCF